MDKTRERLRYSFQQGANILRGFGENANRSFIQPNVRKYQIAVEERPLRTIFLSFFVALSLLPVVSFIGFSLFIFGLFTFIALSVATFASVATITFVGFFFVATISILFLISLSITAAVIASFLALRLVSLVRSEGTSGIREWTLETKERIYGGSKPGFDRTRDETKSMKEEHDDKSHLAEDQLEGDEEETESVLSDAHSAGSTVVVQSPRMEPTDPFKGLEFSDPVVVVKEEQV